jgi:hypothetical protein
MKRILIGILCFAWLAVGFRDPGCQDSHAGSSGCGPTGPGYNSGDFAGGGGSPATAPLTAHPDTVRIRVGEKQTVSVDGGTPPYSFAFVGTSNVATFYGYGTYNSVRVMGLSPGNAYLRVTDSNPADLCQVHIIVSN